MKFDFRKAYYYIVALITFFVLLWGIIDFASALTSYATGKYYPAPQDSEKMEEYYQKKVAQDRMYDSLARILVAGAIFAYSRSKANKLENE